MRNMDVKDPDLQSMDIKNADVECRDTENIDTKDVGTENVDAEHVGTENTDVENVDTEHTDTKNANVENADTEHADTKNADVENVDAKYADTENVVTSGVDFLKKIGGLDVSIVQEAAQEENVLYFKRRRKIKYMAAAALLVICLTAGGGIVAASVFGIQIFDFKSDKNTSSYDVGFITRCRPQDAFGGHIDKVKDIIRRQCEVYKIWSSRMPNIWDRSFDDWESALAYLDIDFIPVPITSRQPKNVELTVVGTMEGPLQSVSLSAFYPSERYNVYVGADIYVDDSEEEIAAQTFSATGGEADYSSETYITANGMFCMLVDTVTMNEDGCTSAEGYIVKDGIMYRVAAILQTRNGEQGEGRMEIVKELLEEIAEK